MTGFPNGPRARLRLAARASALYSKDVRLPVLWLICFLLGGSLPAFGDALIERVQHELRLRKFYFGPVDGNKSLETKKAIKEFQLAMTLDAQGELDEETLRALGLVSGKEAVSEDARVLKFGREWLVRYWQACESGDWAKEEPFYADKVLYYFEGVVTRDYIRARRLEFYARWPARKHTAVLSYASLAPALGKVIGVSARVRNEVGDREGKPRVFTDELFFLLRENEGEWRIVEAREWPLVKESSNATGPR